MFTVLLPIRVPKEHYCLNKNLGIKCWYFNSLSGCYNGFKPVKVTGSIYEKDKECQKLKLLTSDEI